MKDATIDDGTEPDTFITEFWNSQDVWVRNQNDGFTHQNSEAAEYYNPCSVTTNSNYVYVKVRNRGYKPSVPGAELHVYWAMAAAGISWDDSWINNTINKAGCTATIFWR
ncbi:MAG: hypothetical protein IPH45_19120 [Bacteroidales bacterium]|nr:hypothetical protein [Bacteroidales bacterium]